MAVSAMFLCHVFILILLIGLPVSVQIPSGHEKCLLVTDPLALVETLNKLGGQHGVGRIDIVENRFLGLKVFWYFRYLCRVIPTHANKKSCDFSRNSNSIK